MMDKVVRDWDERPCAGTEGMPPTAGGPESGSVNNITEKPQKAANKNRFRHNCTNIAAGLLNEAKKIRLLPECVSTWNAFTEG